MNLLSTAQPQRLLRPSAAPRSSLRVGLLLPCWAIGGVERYHLALARWTNPSVIQWSGCALTASAITKQQTIDQLASLMPIHMDRFAGGIQAEFGCVRHETEKQAIDAVLANSDVILAWGVPDVTKHLQGFAGPVFVISHGDGDWTRAWLRDAERRATHTVAVSRDAAQAFSDPDAVFLMPGGVELDRIAPLKPCFEIRESLGIGGRYAVGFVGRFSSEKKPLLNAQIVGALGEKYVAVYHGQHFWKEDDFKMVAASFADGRIVFAGPEHHTGDIFSALDCLVVGSDAEGGPLVALEAWLTETPLVCKRIGMVRDNPDMLTTNPVDTSLDAWAAAVKKVCTSRDPSLTDVRRKALTRFSAAAMAKRWEDLIVKACR